MFLKAKGKVRAPEFPKSLLWFNGDELSLKTLRKKVVLIDFWTYSCVNCIRTLPHLQAWHRQYEEDGLVIIGVHTPEFDFEKNEENVKNAMDNFAIEYPVVLDPDYKIWNLYANRWWPRKLLIDGDGYIVYDHIGEGGYMETEQAIQRELSRIGVKNLPPIKPDMSVGGGICYRTTPEIHLGYLRGRFANVEALHPGEEILVTDAGEKYELDKVYLHGHWQLGKESVKHARALSLPNEYLLLKYDAFSVNLVMGSENGKECVVEIELDGKPLPQDFCGEDVERDGSKAIVRVKEKRMYRLVGADIYHSGKLKLKTGADNLAMYAFTFGGCAGM